MNKLIFAVALSLGLTSFEAYAQCVGNLLVNGSFDGVPGEAVTASGWTGNSTPDLNDVNGAVNTASDYSWTGTPLASPNGGTWQNLCCGIEDIQQTVTLTPGQVYNLCLEYAMQGIASSLFTFADPVGVRVYINDSLAFTTPDDSTTYTWESACFSFVAANSTVTIRLAPTDIYNEYLGIDGVCLTLDENASIDTELRSAVIYFNSLTGTLDVSTGGMNHYEIILYSLAAQTLARRDYASSISISTESLANGMYIYGLRSKEGPMKFGKFVKTKN